MRSRRCELSSTGAWRVGDEACKQRGWQQDRFTVAELTKEVVAIELEGLQVRASDAMALIEEGSEEIELLEVLGNTGRKF